jgi:hypothetical protein
MTKRVGGGYRSKNVTQRPVKVGQRGEAINEKRSRRWVRRWGISPLSIRDD